MIFTPTRTPHFQRQTPHFHRQTHALSFRATPPFQLSQYKLFTFQELNYSPVFLNSWHCRSIPEGIHEKGMLLISKKIESNFEVRHSNVLMQENL